jgi:hypothetical protein
LNFNKGFTAKSSAILKVLFNEEIAAKIARAIPILLNSTFRLSYIVSYPTVEVVGLREGKDASIAVI